jgi:hypothetical protein
MIEVEARPRKSSQFRNLQIATVVPEMLRGIFQRAALRLVKEHPESPVSNAYAFRARPQFVPFVFNEAVPMSLIVCETRHMSAYQQIALEMDLKTLFITSPKQMK